MSLHEAFLQAIREAPQDDTPRLIYADYLDDNGDSDRAAFIRAQCRLAHLENSTPEAALLRGQAVSLLREHWEEWVDPVGSFLGPNASRHGEHVLRGPFRPGCLNRFKRGFIESLSLDVEQFVAHWATLARHMPLVDLRLWGAGRGLEAFASLPYLRGVAFLHFRDYFDAPLTSAGAQVLADSPHLSYLRGLYLYENSIHDEGVAAITGASWVENLESLNLSNTATTPVALMTLAAARMPRLQDLCFGDNSVCDRGLVYLANAAWFGQLRILDLHDALIEEPGIEAFAAAPHHSALGMLDLSRNTIGPGGGRLLAGATILKTVTALNLARCDLGDTGVEALASSPRLQSLRRLSLDENQLTARALEAIAASPNLPRLELLSIHGNHFSAGAVAGLIPSPRLPQLRWLHVLARAPQII
jgi:uncharacterized protein (TIGR02996 family)